MGDAILAGRIAFAIGEKAIFAGRFGLAIGAKAISLALGLPSHRPSAGQGRTLLSETQGCARDR